MEGRSGRAALANRKYGRLASTLVEISTTPLGYCGRGPSSHPAFDIMHNNRAYHQELINVEDMAARANRGIDKAQIGTAITDPTSITR